MALPSRSAALDGRGDYWLRAAYQYVCLRCCGDADCVCSAVCSFHRGCELLRRCCGGGSIVGRPFVARPPHRSHRRPKSRDPAGYFSEPPRKPTLAASFSFLVVSSCHIFSSSFVPPQHRQRPSHHHRNSFAAATQSLWRPRPLKPESYTTATSSLDTHRADRSQGPLVPPNSSHTISIAEVALLGRRVAPFLHN